MKLRADQIRRMPDTIRFGILCLPVCCRKLNTKIFITAFMPVFFLYGCRSWSCVSVEETGVWVLEGMVVPSRIFRARLVKVIVGLRQLQSEGEWNG